jgi:general secretion pathway protein D
MRIAADENTNSLVIIANSEDYRVVESVIRKLDIERKQVFVDAVILELSSEDTFNLGLAAHLPTQPSPDSVGFVGGQFGTQSLGLTQDLLSGLAVGVFGQGVEVPLSDGQGGTIPVEIPAFGIVLNALKTNSSVNIVSNPNILTLDNQEAEIVVGRRVPFPTTGGFSNLGQPITTFQREDVAITLKVTPRVNSSDFVTLEVELEVQEIEEDDSGLSTLASGGPVTSKREEKTTVLIADNQTVVLGGLVGTTDTEVETKLPILGDLPLIGALFRGKRTGSRKTNMIIFLTPHIIDDEDDMYEVQMVKEAQRQEFLRRFYGKSRDEYMDEVRQLLRFSMNHVNEPSQWRGPTAVEQDTMVAGEEISAETIDALNDALDENGFTDPGAGAGTLPEVDELDLGLPGDDLGPADPPTDAPVEDTPVDAPVEEAP